LGERKAHDLKSTFTYNNVTLEYITIGDGKEVVLCIHGFGRTAEDFLLFEDLLQPGQRIVAINILAHGNSTFPSSRISKDPLSKSEWSSLVTAFLKSLNIEHFHLIGYSMGGRLAMVLAEQIPEKIKSLILLAPDGLKVNWVYRFVSETKLGRVLYRCIIENPNWILRTVDFLRFLRVLHPKIQRFVHFQLETKTRRQLVYDAWLIHRQLFPRLPVVAHNMEAHKIPFELVFGAYDKVIPARDGKRLLRHFKTEHRPVVLNLGHRLLHHSTVAYLSEKGLWMPMSKR
jgi:pimeloyl-ACP methyl ester carboxylesterase